MADIPLTLTQEIYRLSHKLYYDSSASTWETTRWLGHRMLKSPMDLWTYQELVYKLKPNLIIETGTFEGGSAFYFASLMDLIGRGEVVTVDIESRPKRPTHPRITYVTGSSTDDEVLRLVRDRAQDKRTVMVVLDSDHSEAHVRRELELYSPLVTPGSYLVVEDTNVNGHPVFPEFGPGPMEALQNFLSSTTDFEIDQRRERHLFSFYPSGWLRRRESDENERAREERRAKRRDDRHQGQEPDGVD